MKNTVDLLNLYINGLLPEAVTRKALELESREDEPNQDVSELLGILSDGIEEDTNGASK